MPRVKLWDVIWVMMGIGAVALCAKGVLDLLSLSYVDWLPVLVVVSLGGFVGAIPYLSDKIINRETAGVWLVFFFICFIFLSLWPGVITELGFAACSLVCTAGYFRHRLLSARHSSE